MVKIRLARGGAKKQPFFHIVATDSRNARDGRSIERLGYFNPMARGQERRLVVDVAKVDAWRDKGAQISERVQHLLREARRDKSDEPKTKAESKPVTATESTPKVEAEGEARGETEAKSEEKTQSE